MNQVPFLFVSSVKFPEIEVRVLHHVDVLLLLLPAGLILSSLLVMEFLSLTSPGDEAARALNNNNKPTQKSKPTYQARVRYPPCSIYVVKKDAKKTKADDWSVCPNKEMDPTQMNHDGEVSQTASSRQDVTKKASAKSRLNEICTVERWKLPKYECCNEEGPGHSKLFTLKVVVEIQKPEGTTLECYGGPQPTKKKAAEHAAEGALWYLRQTGNKLAANK